MLIGGDEADRHAAMRGALDPARREEPVRIAIDQKRQHHAPVIPRLASAPIVHLERRNRHSLNRFHNEMSQIVLRDPIRQIRRKQ